MGTGSERQDRLTRAWGHRYVSTCLWCSGLDARTGSELGLVSVVHKPHAGDPLQLLSGVHLPGDRAGLRSASPSLPWHPGPPHWSYSSPTAPPLTYELAPTSCTCSLARKSEGCIRDPMTLTLPCTTRASSGRSVLMPTRPWWKTVSGSCARCHRTSLSLSNWPGLEAYGKLGLDQSWS